MSQSHGTSIHFLFHNSYKCGRNISTTTCSSEFVPSVLNAGSTTRGKYLLPPLLLSLHEPQHLAKILVSLIIIDLSNNMMLHSASMKLMEVFQKKNQIQAEFSSTPCSNAVLCSRTSFQQNGTGIFYSCLKYFFRNVVRTWNSWTFFSWV